MKKPLLVALLLFLTALCGCTSQFDLDDSDVAQAAAAAVPA